MEKMLKEERKAAIGSLKWKDGNTPVGWKPLGKDNWGYYFKYVVYRGVWIHLRVQLALNTYIHFCTSVDVIRHNNRTDKKSGKFFIHFNVVNACYGWLDGEHGIYPKSRKATTKKWIEIQRHRDKSGRLLLKELIEIQLYRDFDYIDFMLDSSEKEFGRMRDGMVLTLKKSLKKAQNGMRQLAGEYRKTKG